MGASAAINHIAMSVYVEVCACVCVWGGVLLDHVGVVAQTLWSPCKSGQLKRTHWQESTSQASVCPDNVADI